MNILTSANDIRKSLQSLGPLKVAAAYIGAGWDKYLPPNQLTEIIVSPTMGSNPKAIEHLISILGYSKVHFYRNLHAKVYIGEYALLLGSCNLSDNGLADSHLQEAAVVLSDQDSLKRCNASFIKWRDVARRQYPDAAAKKKQLKALKALWEKAEWHGVLPGNETPSSPQIADYTSDLDRIHISWYQPINLDYDTRAISAAVPDAQGVDPDDFFSDAMTFQENDDIQIGDWVLCWQANNNGSPRKNGDITWMRVHHVIPNGISDEDYPNLAGQAASLVQGAPPFQLDKLACQCIRDALSSGYFPEFISLDDSSWPQPSIDESKRFVKYIVDKATRHQTSKPR